MQPMYRALALAVATAASLPGYAATDDDALGLEAPPPAAGAAPAGNSVVGRPRLAFEVAGQFAERGDGLGSSNGHRLGVDLRWSGALGAGWRFGLSDRLDDLHPAPSGQRNARNSLREVYAGWQSDEANTTLEIGRLNQRHGPAYGYNPTDYFRSGAVRTLITADPIALRENRLGTFMFRASRLWTGGSAAIAWAPRLTNEGASDKTLSLDLGATNTRHRVLLTATNRASERWSGEVLMLAQEGMGGANLGANLTGLMTDWAVLHAEWSSTRTNSLTGAAPGAAVTVKRVHQASLGLTFTLPGNLSLTTEAEYNGGGLNQQGWQQVFALPPTAVASLFTQTQADQELASRRAWLLYATQKGGIVKQLDLAAFVRHNPLDHSALAWAEARYHWPRFDAALQWQRSYGGGTTEYGALPYHQLFQLVGIFYF